jgi:hypothetical protein
MTIDCQCALPPLEEECKACDASGCYEGENCQRCNGFGRSPTLFGKQVLDLVIHQFSAIVERVSDGRS